jgi:hypothetical protein
MKLSIRAFFRKSVGTFQVLLKSDKDNGSLHEDVLTFMTMSHRILLVIRNFSNKYYRESQTIYFTFSNFFSKIVPFMR